MGALGWCDRMCTVTANLLFNIEIVELYAIISMMIRRRIQPELEQLLTTYPAVALLGPRQSGKTTLALDLAEHFPTIYLDLESTADQAKIQKPSSIFLSTKINWLSWMKYNVPPDYSRTCVD